MKGTIGVEKNKLVNNYNCGTKCLYHISVFYAKFYTPRRKLAIEEYFFNRNPFVPFTILYL